MLGRPTAATPADSRADARADTRAAKDSGPEKDSSFGQGAQFVEREDAALSPSASRRVSNPDPVAAARLAAKSYRVPTLHSPSRSLMEQTATERRLVVGRDISLAGEIKDCEHLVVEGRVESNLPEGQLLEIAQSGCFVGNAQVARCRIAGLFKGRLVVTERLNLAAGGRVEGNLRYREMVVEAGGKVSGEIQPLEAEETPPQATQGEVAE